MIRDGYAHRLLTHDQLLQEQQAGRVFNNFKEGMITFDPSYKYVPGANDSNYNTNTGSSSSSSSSSIDHDIRSNNYHANRNSNGNKRIHSYKKDRTPAWCYRILWSLKSDRLASCNDNHHHHQSNDEHHHHNQSSNEHHHHYSSDENNNNFNNNHHYHSGSNDCLVHDQLDSEMGTNHDYHHDNLINSMVVDDNVNVIESNDETIEKCIDKVDVNRVNCDNNASRTLVSNTIKSLSSISSSSPPTSSSRDSVSTVQPQPQQQLPSQSLQASLSSSSPNSSSRRLSPTLPYYHSFSPFDKRMHEGLELMEYSR